MLTNFQNYEYLWFRLIVQKIISENNKRSGKVSETTVLIPKRIHDSGQYKGAAETNQSPGIHTLLLFNKL